MKKIAGQARAARLADSRQSRGQARRFRPETEVKSRPESPLTRRAFPGAHTWILRPARCGSKRTSIGRRRSAHWSPSAPRFAAFFWRNIVAAMTPPPKPARLRMARYRRGHDHDSFLRRFHTRLPASSPRHIGNAHVAFDYFHGLRSCDMPISWLDHKPHAIAVYASWPPLPSAHATLTTGRPATALPRPVFHRLDCASFSCSCLLAPSEIQANLRV
jgi:hypothetical protein